MKQHPNADRLTLVEIDYGSGVEQVVTGAPNIFPYKDAATLPVLKVAFARNGAVLIDAYSEESPRPKKKLKGSKIIRGIPSNGMVCSERELGLSGARAVCCYQKMRQWVRPCAITWAMRFSSLA